MSAASRVGNLIVYDNGAGGLSWEWFYFDFLNRSHSTYNGISGDDMLEYSFIELKPHEFDTGFTEEEKAFFVSEYYRIKENARHSDYYDANDNCWKNH